MLQRHYDRTWDVSKQVQNAREEILRCYASRCISIHLSYENILPTRPYTFNETVYANLARISTELAHITPSIVAVPTFEYHFTVLMYAMGLFCPSIDKIKVAIAGIGYQWCDKLIRFDYDSVSDDKLRNEISKFPNNGLLTEKEPQYAINGKSAFVRMMTGIRYSDDMDTKVQTFLQHFGSFRASGIFTFELCLTPLTLTQAHGIYPMEVKSKEMFQSRYKRAICQANVLNVWAPILLEIAYTIPYPLHILLTTKGIVEYILPILGYIERKSEGRVIFSAIYHPGHTTGNDKRWEGSIHEFFRSPKTFARLSCPSIDNSSILHEMIGNVLGDKYYSVIALRNKVRQPFCIDIVRDEYDDVIAIELSECQKRFALDEDKILDDNFQYSFTPPKIPIKLPFVNNLSEEQQTWAMLE